MRGSTVLWQTGSTAEWGCSHRIASACPSACFLLWLCFLWPNMWAPQPKRIINMMKAPQSNQLRIFSISLCHPINTFKCDCSVWKQHGAEHRRSICTHAVGTRRNQNSYSLFVWEDQNMGGWKIHDRDTGRRDTSSVPFCTGENSETGRIISVRTADVEWQETWEQHEVRSCWCSTSKPLISAECAGKEPVDATAIWGASIIALIPTSRISTARISACCAFIDQIPSGQKVTHMPLNIELRWPTSTMGKSFFTLLQIEPLHLQTDCP